MWTHTFWFLALVLVAAMAERTGEAIASSRADDELDALGDRCDTAERTAERVTERWTLWKERAAEWRSLYLEERARNAELGKPLILRSGALVPYDASTAGDDDDGGDPLTVAQADRAAVEAERKAREREEANAYDGREPVPIDDGDATPPARLTDVEAHDGA